MKLIVTTEADMSNIETAMKNSDAEVFAKTNQHLAYTITRDGIITTIDIPQVVFIIKKGRLSGLRTKIKRKMLKKAIEMECRRQGYKAEIEVE
jgi:hypothetical protein